jgi:predicted nucleic acid-binding protein
VNLYRKLYIESSVFIEYILEEDTNKCQIIQSIIDAAKSGQFRICTSTWTIAEVYKRKGFSKNALSPEQTNDILPHFREEFIDFVEVDRLLAERAHDLCRQYPENGKDKSLRPGDAVHIAAAEREPNPCDVILSYDPDFLKLKYDKIKIEEPTLQQFELTPKT